MSVQKLIAEADRFLGKGQIDEALAKVKAAFSEEPLNQLVATKLANILIQNRQPHEAAKVYSGLAKRLSDAGKSQVAIAIFKQALELTPDDVALRTRFAQECESVGKLGDAFLQGQIALNFYLRRKKFFDASNVLPLMARAQPKDEKIKIAWVEVLQLCQAEQKLIHFLVALCGPPGLASQEFPVGGEPAALSPPLYEGIKRLVPFFPRDPKVAYAVAWAAYRRGQNKEFFHYLHECLRREPDFCLGILLFARFLAEDKKLNEALFAYRYFKERMTADKSSDMLTLNRLMEAFVEKNGWVRFMEDGGDLLDTAGFVKSLTGVEQEAPKESPEEKEKTDSKNIDQGDGALELPPAEIELGTGATGDMEILNATGQSIAEVQQKRPAAATSNDPMRIQAELIKATIEATVANMGGAGSTQQTMVQPGALQAAAPEITKPPVSAPVEAPPAPKAPEVKFEPAPVAQAAPAAAKPEAVAPATSPSIEAPPAPKAPEVKFEPAPVVAASPVAVTEPKPEREEPTDEVEGFQGESVEFTSLVRLDQAGLAALGAPPAGAPAPAPGEKSAEEVEAEGADATSASQQRKLFNPLEQAAASSAEEPQPEREERTQMFSPMDVLDAAQVMSNRELRGVNTKKIEVDPAQLAPPPPVPEKSAEDRPEADKTRWKELRAPGEATAIFSPVEAVQAVTDSRRPMEITVKAPSPPLPSSAARPPEPAIANEGAEGATVIVQRPTQAQLLGETPGEKNDGAGEAPPAKTEKTGRVELDPLTPEASGSREFMIPVPPVVAGAVPGFVAEPPKASDAPAETQAESPAFMPIPAAVASSRAGAGTETPSADLGDDLLEGPTRIFTQPTPADKTEHLLKEIKNDLKDKAGDRLDIDLLMRKADRYTAKRNYYLARKALRHAQALGADEEFVKQRLREIRKLELPDGLYNTISSDRAERPVDSAAMLESLEHEFDLGGDEEGEQLGVLVERRIEEIFRDTDARTILDFGVGLHEMGLFRQAEALFIRLVEEFPEQAFDAYYLAAIAKLARRDYAGAASILNRLSADSGKSDQEKIQIYYALGETFEKMRQRERSLKFFQKVAELDANYRNVRHKLSE